MPKTQMGRRTRQTREDIYAAAMSLFARDGVADVSMQMIADQAQTARSTVFKHYPQKQDLLSDFFMRLGDDVLALAKSQSPTSLRNGMQQLYQSMQAEALKVEPVLREVAWMAVGKGPLAEEEAAIDNQMIVHISALVRLGVETGEVRGNINARDAAKLILCVITETNHDAINGHRISKLAAEQMGRFDMLFHGFRV
jgi:AcrR family transcriptional regulator